MKRFIVLLLSVVLFASCFSFGAGANSGISVEFLENGAYIVTQITYSIEELDTKAAHKTSTYYSACNIPVFTATVTGKFAPAPNGDMEATYSKVRVAVFEDSAEFIYKMSECDGNEVYSYSYIEYLGITRVLSPKLTCDKYGNLS